MKENTASNAARERIDDFDPIKHLIDEDSINAYLADIQQANDPVLLKLALQNVEQARFINSSKK